MIQGFRKAPDIYWLLDQKTLALSVHQENDLFNAREQYEYI